MDFTVENFKAISNFEYRNIKDLTVLTGINSGGKSSFLHSLLMMKQSCIAGNSATPVILNGEYVSLGNFKDIYHQNSFQDKNMKQVVRYKLTYNRIKDKQMIKKIEDSLYHSIDNTYFILSLARKINPHSKFDADFMFQRNQDSYTKIDNLLIQSIENQLEEVNIVYEFKSKYEKTIVSKLKIIFHFQNVEVPIYLSLEEYREARKYKIETNSPLFFGESDLIKHQREGNLDSLESLTISEKTPLLLEEIHYTNGIVEFEKLIPYIKKTNKPKIKSYFDVGFSKLLANFLSDTFINFFESISYLGPLREAPQSLYLKRNDYNEHMGSKGENLINIFVQNKETLLETPKIDENGKIYTEKTTLIEGLNYWMCEKFNMAKSIEIKEHNEGKISQVLINNFQSIQIPISSVGFGVSQIMPIIVEGLLLKKKQTLLLEQPEIHLHPRLQSLLFDFLHALTILNRQIIVETHSDHFINRLRRRIAEQPVNDKKAINNSIGLFFVENNQIDSIYIDEFGVMEYWPAGFFDQSSSENLALVKAQALKRKNYQQLQSRGKNV